MKVLLFPASYAPVVGGLQTVAQSLAKNLRLRGHEVRVVTNRYPRSLRPHEEIDARAAVEVCAERGAGTMGDAKVTNLVAACRSYSENFDGVAAPMIYSSRGQVCARRSSSRSGRGRSRGSPKRG